MKYLFLEDRISLVDDNKELAYLSFIEKDDTIDIISTYVNHDLRGKSIASILMEKIYNYAKERDKKINPICSYAKAWLEKK